MQGALHIFHKNKAPDLAIRQSGAYSVETPASSEALLGACALKKLSSKALCRGVERQHLAMIQEEARRQRVLGYVLGHTFHRSACDAVILVFLKPLLRDLAPSP